MSDQRPVATDTATTDQDQATQGSYIVNNFNLNNDNDPAGQLPNHLANDLTTGSGADIVSGLESSSAAGSNTMKNARAGHLQVTHVHQTITTGGTTPTVTGESSGQASAAGTTTQSATTDQTIKAAVEAAVQAALQGQQHGGQAGVEGSQSTANQQTAEMRAKLLETEAENAALRKRLAEQALNPAPSGPTTQPAADDPGDGSAS